VHRPALDKFAFTGVELKDQVRSRVTGKELAIVVHREFREMPRPVRRGDHVSNELIGFRTRLRLQDSYSFIRIKSRILAAVTKIDELGCRVVKEPVRIRLELECPDQSEGLALKDPQGTVKARDIQFVEVTT
jgi:hypothetical protein